MAFDPPAVAHDVGDEDLAAEVRAEDDRRRIALAARRVVHRPLVGSADVSCDHEARIAASRSASVTAAAASGAGSVGISRTSVPSEARTNPHRSKKPATSAPHSTRNRSTGAPLTTASTSERPMPCSRRSSSTKRFVSASSRSPMRSMPMPADEPAVVVPADEEPRGLVQQQLIQRRPCTSAASACTSASSARPRRSTSPTPSTFYQRPRATVSQPGRAGAEGFAFAILGDR